jgi:uncharacterized protein YkwD
MRAGGFMSSGGTFVARLGAGAFLAATGVVIGIGAGCGATLPAGGGTVASVPDSTAFDTCDAIGVPADATLEAMYDELNRYRLENGLGVLTYSRTLEAAANEHARDMYERGFFDHVNPDGEGPAERALRAGFCHPWVGENVAEGFLTPASAQAAWEASPEHNTNMLDPRYDLVGMGHYVAPTGLHYWVQVFALPRL